MQLVADRSVLTWQVDVDAGQSEADTCYSLGPAASERQLARHCYTLVTCLLWWCLDLMDCCLSGQASPALLCHHGRLEIRMTIGPPLSLLSILGVVATTIGAIENPNQMHVCLSSLSLHHFCGSSCIAQQHVVAIVWCWRGDSKANCCCCLILIMMTKNEACVRGNCKDEPSTMRACLSLLTMMRVVVDRGNCPLLKGNHRSGSLTTSVAKKTTSSG
jgi:hypothetical protein